MPHFRCDDCGEYWNHGRAPDEQDYITACPACGKRWVVSGDQALVIDRVD